MTVSPQKPVTFLQPVVQFKEYTMPSYKIDNNIKYRDISWFYRFFDRNRFPTSLDSDDFLFEHNDKYKFHVPVVISDEDNQSDLVKDRRSSFFFFSNFQSTKPKTRYEYEQSQKFLAARRYFISNKLADIWRSNDFFLFRGESRILDLISYWRQKFLSNNLVHYYRNENYVLDNQVRENEFFFKYANDSFKLHERLNLYDTPLEIGEFKEKKLRRHGEKVREAYRFRKGRLEKPKVKKLARRITSLPQDHNFNFLRFAGRDRDKRIKGLLKKSGVQMLYRKDLPLEFKIQDVYQQEYLNDKLKYVFKKLAVKNKWSVFFTRQYYPLGVRSWLML